MIVAVADCFSALKISRKKFPDRVFTKVGSPSTWKFCNDTLNIIYN